MSTARYIGSYLLIFSFLVTSCESRKEDKNEKDSAKEYTITGNIKNAKGWIALKRIDNQKLLTADSTKLSESGDFELTASASEPDFYVLTLQDSLTHLLILDAEKLTVSADAANFQQTFQCKGSKATNEYSVFTDKINTTQRQQNLIKQSIPRLIQKNDMDSLKVIELQLKDAQGKAAAFVKSYIDSIVPSLAIFNLIGYLNIETEFDYLQGLSKKLNERLPESKYTSMLSKEINNMLAMEKKLNEGGVAIGTAAPDISLPNPDGKTVALSSFRGKYVLLDFWASWCGPCRAENPNVVRLYNKYKSKNFEILSVSLDKEKTSWLAAIKKDGLVWNHISDLKFWESSVVPLYGIEGIPATYLLDKEGKVIAKNLRGAELEHKLSEVLQ